MNNTCVILVLVFAFVSCTLSSYLDIPAPPERPIRFKTKEQIETYLKAVKDYYDAFKVKLVRRENAMLDYDSNLARLTQDDLNDESDLLKKLYYIYYDQENQPIRNSFRQRRQEGNSLI